MTKKILVQVVIEGQKGGSGSGNFGHSGRPGKLGGSIPKGAGGGAGAAGVEKPAEPAWLTDASLQSKRQLDKTQLSDMTDAEQLAARTQLVSEIQTALNKPASSKLSADQRTKVDAAMSSSRDDNERSFAGVSALLGGDNKVPGKLTKSTPAAKRAAVLGVMDRLGYHNESDAVAAWNTWSQMQ